MSTITTAGEKSDLAHLLETRDRAKEKAKRGAAIWFAALSFGILGFYSGLIPADVLRLLAGVGWIAAIYMCANIAVMRGYLSVTGAFAGVLGFIGLAIIFLIPNQMNKRIEAAGGTATSSTPKTSKL